MATSPCPPQLAHVRDSRTAVAVATQKQPAANVEWARGIDPSGQAVLARDTRAPLRGLGRTFLQCGFLAGGFQRFRCGECKTERLVAFSCKGRGFCPSCGGRRMAERAEHLVGHALPDVPVRQWVLTVPHRLRYLLAWHQDLCRGVDGRMTGLRSTFSSSRRFPISLLVHVALCRGVACSHLP